MRGLIPPSPGRNRVKKSMSKQTPKLRIHSKPDRNQSKVTVCNDEKNEDSNEEDMSVNSENNLIEEDLQDLQPSLSNDERNEDYSEDSNEEDISVNSENILIKENLQDFEELNSIGQSGY